MGGRGSDPVKSSKTGRGLGALVGSLTSEGNRRGGKLRTKEVLAGRGSPGRVWVCGSMWKPLVSLVVVWMKRLGGTMKRGVDAELVASRSQW